MENLCNIWLEKCLQNCYRYPGPWKCDVTQVIYVCVCVLCTHVTRFSWFKRTEDFCISPWLCSQALENEDCDGHFPANHGSFWRGHLPVDKWSCRRQHQPAWVELKLTSWLHLNFSCNCFISLWVFGINWPQRRERQQTKQNVSLAKKQEGEDAAKLFP